MPDPAAVDWMAAGTLHNRSEGYAVRTDPLWILVTTARQGHEGPLESMHIVMADGTEYGPESIQRLAMRPDRPNRVS